MWFKLLIFAFLFTASYQLPNPADQDGPDGNLAPMPGNADEDGLAEKRAGMSDALAKLKSILQTAISSAVAKLEQLIKNIEKTAQSIINQAGRKFEGEGKPGELEELEKLEKNAGVDMPDVFENAKEIIKDPKKSLPEKAKKCVKDKADEAVKLIKKAIDDIKRVGLGYDDLEKKAKNCKNNVICLVKVTAEIGKNILKLPKVIGEHASKATSLASKSPSDLKKCVTSAKGSAEVNSDEVL